MAGEYGMVGGSQQVVSGPGDAAQALAQLTRITVGATACLRSSFESDVTSNRAVQLLLTIGLQPGITPGGLGQQLGVSRSMVSQLLARVRSTGYIRSDADSRDRRSSHLRLTPLGQKRLSRLEESLGRWFFDHRELLAATARNLGAAEVVPGSQPHGSALDATMILARAGAGYVVAASELTARRGLGDPNERLAISLIAAAGALRPAELARELRLGSSGVAGLLNRLQAAGLASRRDPQTSRDRRAVEVVLTVEGSALARELAELLLEDSAPFVAGLHAAGAVASRIGAA